MLTGFFIKFYLFLQRIYNRVISNFLVLNKKIFLILYLFLIQSILFVICAGNLITKNKILYMNSRIAIHHSIRVLLTMIIIFYFATISKEKLLKFLTFFSFIIILLLFSTIFITVPINNARRWIKTPLFNIQPATFMFVVFPYVNTMLIMKKKYKKSLIFFFSTVLILFLQPDFGSTIILCGTWIGQHLINGSILLYIPYILFLILFSIPILFIFGQHVLARIMLHINGTGEWGQVFFATNSIKSSGLWGAKRISHIPDMHNDFFFASFCNMTGIFGGVILLSGFTYIFYIIFWKKIYEIKKNSQILVFGLTIAFMLQCLLHFLSNVAIIPPKGISLPFLSFGGSSLFANGLLMGVILNFLKKTE